MDVERELNIMVDQMRARTGFAPDEIVCARETLEQLVHQAAPQFLVTDTMDEARGYVGRYHGVPIIVSPTAEPGKLYLLQNDQNNWVQLSDSTYEEQDSTYMNTPWNTDAPWWSRGPYSPSTSYSGVLNYSPAWCVKRDEEPEDIDDDSFLDILNGGELNADD